MVSVARDVDLDIWRAANLLITVPTPSLKLPGSEI
jgi:hypothetical protein